MCDRSRREFLLGSAAAGLLAARPEPLLAQASAKPTDMTIARWSGAKPAADAAMKNIAVKLTEQAIEALGGMKRFVSRGDVVWVKPNIGWDRTPETAANTNPDVVATLIRLCFAAGAKTVKVGDNPCDVAQRTYEASGIAAAAREAGAKVVFLDPTRFKEAKIDGEQVKTIPIYPEIIETDLVINVPIVKHHRLAGLTMCMKNYMGVIDKRNTFHQAIAPSVADLTRFMKPRLCILDATRILKANGPKGGKLEDVEAKLTLAAGVDIVALDAWGAEVVGKNPAEIGSIVKGQELGLGKIDYRSLALRELAVS
jgi:uncharacterized protein (DUF362 family)